MTQLEMLTTLVDAARLLPENRLLNRALWRAERRIEVLRARRARQSRTWYRFIGKRRRVLAESFRLWDQPEGTEHILWFRVWRYPEAHRPPEIDKTLPVLEGRMNPIGSKVLAMKNGLNGK